MRERRRKYEVYTAHEHTFEYGGTDCERLAVGLVDGLSSNDSVAALKYEREKHFPLERLEAGLAAG